MPAGVERHRVVILSGVWHEIAATLNGYYDEYSPIVWNIGPVKDEIHVTVVLLHESEIAKQRAAQPPLQMPIMPGLLRR